MSKTAYALFVLLATTVVLLAPMSVSARSSNDEARLNENPHNSIGAVLAKAEPEGDPAKGKEIFQANCAACHGPEGKGDGAAAAALDPKPRNLSDADYVSTLSNEHLLKVITEGGASVGKSPMMAAWGGILSENDILNVIAYVRKDICKCEYKGK
ncbi:MAG: cytochrome c [Thermodesulfobacteriota bacterium]